MRHDSTVSVDYAMTLYYIMTKKAINFGRDYQRCHACMDGNSKRSHAFPFNSGETMFAIHSVSSKVTQQPPHEDSLSPPLDPKEKSPSPPHKDKTPPPPKERTPPPPP
ncbi:hypothetical protein E6C27_scaffold270G001520 [Cucumis melo var. makuwa]|uniref:Uncharacterized protein n=1 Tax=Cucumis melo var. makuwa TaxID=1194695 RepID=A0A5A7T4J9_CUCMM|nr:hypothetical protein E6C27_scaffold270G001520 [Cucumis melo var. makuwa]